MSKSAYTNFDEIALPLNSTLQDLDDETIENFLNNNSNSFSIEDHESRNNRNVKNTNEEFHTNKKQVQSNVKNKNNILKSSGSFQTRRNVNSKITERSKQIDNNVYNEESENENDNDNVNFDDEDYQSDTDYREIDTREITKITKLSSLNNKKALKSFQEAFPFESDRLNEMMQNSYLSNLNDIENDYLIEQRLAKQNSARHSKNSSSSLAVQQKANSSQNKSLSKMDLKRIYEELDSIHNKLVVNMNIRLMDNY
jgi:hypothetical protein